MTDAPDDSAAPGRDSLMSPEDNRRMFDGLARTYDRMNRLMSLGLDRRWRRRAIARLDPQPGQRYLDIGCGTGDLILGILRRCGGAEVVGIDPAENMLAIADAKLRRANVIDAATLQTGDGMDLPFEDASFAGVVSAFCIRNIPDRLRAFREMRRVLVPGGKAVILELTVPRSRIVRWGHSLYTRRLVPLAGRLVARSRASYQYLVDSVEDFPVPSHVAEMMNAAGFENTECTPLSGGIVTLFAARAE